MGINGSFLRRLIRFLDLCDCAYSNPVFDSCDYVFVPVLDFCECAFFNPFLDLCDCVLSYPV